jgi:hypothetical protein
MFDTKICIRRERRATTTRRSCASSRRGAEGGRARQWVSRNLQKPAETDPRRWRYVSLPHGMRQLRQAHRLRVKVTPKDGSIR